MQDEIERQVTQFLENLDVPFEVIPIDPALADTAEFCAHYGFPLDHAGNTIICASKREPTQYCACVVTATTRLDVNHAVKRLMGVSRLSFAGAEETKALTGMMIGGVTVFALPPALPIYVDERVMALDYVIVGSGSRSSKLKIAPAVLRHVPNAHVVPDLAVEPPPSP